MDINLFLKEIEKEDLDLRKSILALHEFFLENHQEKELMAYYDLNYQSNQEAFLNFPKTFKTYLTFIYDNLKLKRLEISNLEEFKDLYLTLVDKAIPYGKKRGSNSYQEVLKTYYDQNSDEDKLLNLNNVLENNLKKVEGHLNDLKYLHYLRRECLINLLKIILYLNDFNLAFLVYETYSLNYELKSLDFFKLIEETLNLKALEALNKESDINSDTYYKKALKLNLEALDENLVKKLAFLNEKILVEENYDIEAFKTLYLELLKSLKKTFEGENEPDYSFGLFSVDETLELVNNSLAYLSNDGDFLSLLTGFNNGYLNKFKLQELLDLRKVLEVDKLLSFKDLNKLVLLKYEYNFLDEYQLYLRNLEVFKSLVK